MGRQGRDEDLHCHPYSDPMSTSTRYDGVFAVLPTPFAPDDSIDVASLRNVVRLYLGAGVDGLTALGVTSEAGQLTAAERLQVLDVVIEEAGGRVPVVVGATAPGLEQCIGYARLAKSSGAAAVMIAPPPASSFDPQAVRSHFEGVAAAVDLPIVIQDYPQQAGFSIPASTLAAMLREIGNAAAVKLEDSPTAPKLAQIIRELGPGNAPIFGGLGGAFLFEELLAGSAGAMTGFAFPEALLEIVRLFRAGEVDQAAQRFYFYVPLIRFEFQVGVGLAIRKEILRRRGVIAHPGVRPPATPLDPTTRDGLDRLMEWYRTTGPAWLNL